MLSQEKAEQIKEQLISQIDSSEVEDKESIKKQIKKMTPEQLEQFLKQNNLVKDSDEENCIFCSIASGKMQAYKIDEIPEAIAVLEINPISPGHIIIIPKIHSENAQKQAFELAKKIAKVVSEIFNPKKVEIVNTSMFGHEIINILPIYNNENIHSQKKQASPKELAEVQKKLNEKLQTENSSPSMENPPEEIKKPEILTDKNTWLPKRIP